MEMTIDRGKSTRNIVSHDNNKTREKKMSGTLFLLSLWLQEMMISFENQIFPHIALTIKSTYDYQFIATCD